MEKISLNCSSGTFMKTNNLSFSSFAKRLFSVFLSVIFLLLLSCNSGDQFTEEATPTYSISGSVTKSDGSAASGASVMVVKISDGSDAGQSSTNAAGEYIITGLNAGSYKTTVTLNGYETASVDEVKVTNADVIISEVVLQKITVPTYSISGTVSNPDGSAATGASVQLLKASDNTNVGQAVTTDASGAYSISNIPAGAYNIIFALKGYETGILTDITVNNANISGKDISLKTVTVNEGAIRIVYSDADATISNLPSDESITVTKSGADITFASSSNGLVEFHVSGSTSNGSLKIQNNASVPNTIRLTLESAIIESASKLPPIQITKNEGITIVELKGASILSDNALNEENATLISKSGSLEFEGFGKLIINGTAKHALGSSKKSITVRGGDITVASAASDGFHAEVGFVQSGGTLDITASGDGIDAGTGTAEINGGNLRIASSADDVKGIKGDAGVSISGGIIAMNVSGAKSKGISSKADITISGGDIAVVTSGRTVLEPLDNGYNPSYCTAIKSDANITISGGTIRLESLNSADGGKGISADGDILISGGTLDITTAGDGKVYTNETGTTDSYSATCIKSDKNISLLGGDITCSSTGTGGKCINAGGTLTIGNKGANNSELTLSAATSGERFFVTGSSGGSGGGRPGGGGFGDDGTDYANPKAIKSLGDMTINSGTIYVNCTQKTEGGEGLESKGTMTINGGNLDVRTYDDCLNAATEIIINGGNIFCAASGQDAIDSNGPLTINGGFTIANGVRGDGEAFDAERNFRVNGGIIVGTHGGMSMTTPSGTQRSVRIQATAGSPIGIKTASGETLLLFNIPVIAGATIGTSVVVTFSDPRLVSGTYTFMAGGSISGGTTVNGYNTGGTYSGGSTKSFTL